VIVLDTHAWVWFVGDPDRLSRPARAAIEGSLSDASIHVSSISCWEVALLVKKGRLELSMDVAEWVDRAASLAFLRFVAVDNGIAVGAVHLAAPLHDDPADRIIVATTLSLGATLVTKDRRLRRYRAVRTIW
jgi:PIN domain nuclease of toxin-antitoxin system